jgi:hypothetical protein
LIIASRHLSTAPPAAAAAPQAAAAPAKPAEPVPTKVYYLVIFSLLLFQFIHILLTQIYGGLKDQDRIFTNLYGQQVFFSPRLTAPFFPIMVTI